MVTKRTLIFRDVLYAVLVVIILLPANKVELSLWAKILVIAVAIGQRIWQHVNYYKETGRIY